MGTTMREWRQLHFFAVVMLLSAGVAATILTSCSGSGDGDSNGGLCEECGDTDGPCLPTVDVSGDDRPSFCGTADPCTVELRCLRKLDSGQRRCFAADPVTNALDTQYRCDGARPNPDTAPTTTATPLPTFTPSATATPVSTDPTATGQTATPTPASTATPDEEVEVDITINTDDDEFNASFTVTVTYPAAKGSFLKDGVTDCDPDDDGLTPQDDGNGTLTLAFPGDSEGVFALSVTCTFRENAGQTLVVDADLSATASSSSLTVEISEL